MDVIQTRLFKPLVQDGYLIRLGLLDKLIKNQYKPVTLVVAPAGYGKSVAVSQWLDKTKTNYSWISLHKDCNELKEFLRLLCSSLLPYLNTTEDFCEILNEVSDLPDLDQISRQIINSIASIQDDHILVLDDYHLIENSDIHTLIQTLTANIKQNHIITFISRFEPLLNWNQLKSYDLVNEITAIDLQFSSVEIRDLSSLVFSNPLDSEISSIIFNSTEGWIVPTRIILKNIAEYKLDPHTLIDKSANKLEQTYGFLEDVFSQADEEIQESLMLASLFQRFSISLLLEIYSKEYPEKKQESKFLKKGLEKFITQSLFIISLDNNKNWYRFHDLIRDFLNTRIYSGFSKDKINNALIAGSNFFEVNQSFEEAIQIAVKASDIPLSIAIIERNRLKFLNLQQLDVLERWLNLIPSGVTENYPVLLLTRANVSEKKGEFEKMVQDLESAKTLMPQLKEKEEYSRVQWGEYYSIKSSTDYLMGNINIAITSSEKAMQLLNHENTFLYYIAMLYRVFSLNHLGKSGEAMDLLIQDKIIFTSHHKNIPVENHLIHTIHFMLNGKLNHYGYDAKLARDIAKEESHKTIFVLASYYMALSSYIKNDFEEALSYINEVIEIKYSARPYWTMVCYHLKASCLLALKDLEEYQICIVDLTEYVKKFNVPYYKNLLAIMKMEFNLQMEDFKIIPERIISLDFRLSDMVHVYFKPFLTEVKFLLATNIKPNIEQAEILLIQYREKARLTYNRILLLQVNCLHILLLIKQNNSEKALKLLRELLTETKGDGFIRLYTDCGFEMKKLFDLLSNQEKNDVYANQILQSFNLTYWNERFINEIISNNLEPLHLNKSNTNNIKITIREIKLLNLLNLELHNKEIADIINISTDSVKKSLYRLYKKLNVNSRSEALNKATDLNLLRINPKN